ncbi:protein translocase subunit SecD [Sediminispirochaeta bajacaliforniensis]|uniref:protein translocase subunit SecD n=1 Tax=Sediminispirochaeta bajacaliforniensis TaxID=148 RepID=UPI0003759F87|nr:protein translocase subunit SecD [Sediminispirochaeta bajacaliforniensis]
MSKRSRLFIVLLVLVVCGVFLYPTFEWYFMVPQAQKELAAGSKQQIQAYARGQAAKAVGELKSLVAASGSDAVPEKYAYLIPIAKEHYKLDGRDLPSKWTVSTLLKGFNTEEAAFSAIEGYYRTKLFDLKDEGGSVLQLGLDLSGGMSILLEADLDSLEKRLGHPPTVDDQNQAVQRAMEILNNRIDKFGVTEPQIRQQGTNQINIDIPGAADPERVNSFLMGKGSLSFHIVDQELSQKVVQYFQQNPTKAYDDQGHVITPDFVPAGYVVRGFYEKDSYGIDQLRRWVVVREEVGLDGSHIQNATVGNHPVTGKPVINFTLDQEGGEIFFQLTSTNQKGTLAILMDDKVKSMAVINEPIRERVQMSGFDRKEANDLALVLRTAAMPVDLKINNQQAVGASLGEDSVRQGLKAITLSFILVIIFMLLYYQVAGIVSDIALILNLVIMVSILSAFNLTLTLTSIAGLILTVGMAVDANVIIFERIKEEYRLGKTPEASAKAGFRKAFWTIMDANITTFIAALVLSQLGSGPVQGFANTLAVGIVSSMFTALFVSRLIFDFGIEQLKVKKLSIGWRIR